MGMPPVALGGGDTPVQSPAATPPFLPSQNSDPTQQVNTQAQKILQAIAQASQRKQLANTAVPGAIPQMEDPNAARQIGMNTANPNAWGAQRFMAGLGASIKNAVTKQKQDQLLKAEGDWNYLQSSMNELYQAQQSGDPKAVAAAQAKVDVMMNDPKKLKNMAKALNQDWLNPEKTTVYGEALKNVTAKTQQTEQQKAQAKQGLMGIFKQLLQRRQQPNLSPEQTQAMGREIQAKAPTQEVSDKGALDVLKEQMKEEARAKEDAAKQEAREKEQEAKFAQEKEMTEMREKFTRLRDANQNQFHQTMETMKENAAEQRQNQRDLAMFKMLGMKLDAQQEKLFKPDTNKLNKEVTDSVTSLRQQLSQANSALKSLKTSASNHWLMGPGKEEIGEAEGQVKNLERAIAHIEKNRDAIIKGKAELGDVVGKAYDIMGGTDVAAAVPGFVPDKKP
jgi:hypothetical protein